MSIAIRSAVENDVPAILAIERQSPSAAHWTREEYASRLYSGIVLVAEDAGQLCGFICAQPVLREYEVENIVVDAKVQRRGVASGLLCAFLERAQEEAASAILLEVRDSNLPARRLYEKCGLREVGRRPMYYHDPPEDAILYALRFEC